MSQILGHILGSIGTLLAWVVIFMLIMQISELRKRIEKLEAQDR